ncbi:MAG: CDP-diacylglycerol--serine O-phosphatidyltransferase [Gammaproteobacteria bacterium]|nr:CDP-diacylglycerol--serine O-phosphatidyltransferase [Gammaproteobacteria bacterium]
MNISDEDDKRSHGIYLLPNLFTTAGLFSGFYAIVAATQGRFEAAAIAIFAAMILDGIDGRVARLTNTTSDFGAEYDSLADMVSFGLAPALVMYEWALFSMHDWGWQHWSKVGWLAAFIYVAAAALRLARFNTQVGKADKRFFQGLASPAAAAIMVGLVWLGYDLGYKGSELAGLACITTVVVGLLMVSNFSYYSFKDLGSKNRVPLTAMLAVVFVYVCIAFDPPKVLFTFFVLYMLSGPALTIWRWARRHQRHTDKPDTPA